LTMNGQQAKPAGSEFSSQQDSAPSGAAQDQAASVQGLASEFSFSDAGRVVDAAEPTSTAPAEEAKAEAFGSAAAKIEIDGESAKPQASNSEGTQNPGKVIVMSPRGHGAKPPGSAGEAVFGKRRIAALAAAVTLATAAGALGGAMATAAFTHDGTQAVAGSENRSVIEASLARLGADLQALKAGLEQTSKLGMSQFNKTSDRLDKLEHAQAEPAAKLAKLSEAVERLRAAATVMPTATAAAAAPAIAAPAITTPAITASAATPSVAPAPPKETTGSIPVTPAATLAAAPASTPKVEPARLPTLEGWVLRDVDRGSALIGNRRGVYEVYAGDFIPGLGRIDAIRRQDGRWVVVTSRGLIVAR
jgi:hypothetical protein